MSEKVSKEANDEAPGFEQIWQWLHKLEGEVVSTFATRKSHCYQIVRVLPDGVIRLSKSFLEQNRETRVSEHYFRKTWERLAHVGVCSMEERHAGFVAACLTALPDLDLWYVNTGKGWDYRTLLVLGNPASGDGSACGRIKESRKWDSSRIVSDPKICGGDPTISGTRIMVGNILGMFAGGYTAGAILEVYPRLSMLDLEAALEYSRVKIYRGQASGGS